jgi:hypothetical protein
MSNSYKAASSLGAAALVLSGAAMAAAPTAFDAWTVTGGDITSACPANFTCTTAVTGDGFFQRQITDTDGNDFFQTIITDSGVTGSPGGLSFSDESFVQTGNVGGLADKSSINDTTTTGTLTEVFDAQTTLLTGWASTNGTDDEVMIYQGISAVDTAASAEDFRTDFWLDQTGALGSVGKLMRITSAVDIQEDPTNPQVQDFVLVDRSGNQVDAVDGGVDINGDATDDLTWIAGDNIKAIWVGQDMSLISGVGQEFGYTAYENITDGTSVNDFSLAGGSSSAPIDWNTAAAPTGWGSLATDGTGGPF